MNKKGFLVLGLFLLSILIPAISVSAAEKAPVKIGPEAPATMKVADDKLSVSKWAGESTIDVAMPQIKDFTDYRYETVQLSDGFEVNLILNKPPKVNVFYYPITVKNAEFYYQPPLTPEEIAQGHTRPENVVGSYAVYGVKSNNEYGTGKIMHIYRPKVFDAKGSWVWGVLDYKDGVLSVTVDAAWLAKAVYPVTIDPTFGNTNIGASGESGYFLDVLFGDKATGVVGVVTAIVAYVQKYEGLGNLFKGVLVRASDKNIVSNGVTTATALPMNYTWVTATFSVNPSSTVQDYYICLIGDANYIEIKYDTALNLGFTDASNSFASPTNPTDGGESDEKYSIYAICQTIAITSSIIANMDDSDNCYTMKDYYTIQTVITNFGGAADILNVSVRGAQGAAVRWQVNATELNSTAVYTLVTGSTTNDLNSAACTFIENGNVGTLSLKLIFYWNATSEDDLDLAVWAANVDGDTVGWTTVHSDYFDVINRLTTTNLSPSIDGIDINTALSIHGDVRYATTTTGDTSSSSYPPDGQFTAVSVIDDLAATVGTDTAIVDGYFYVIFNSAGTMRTTYYHVYLDMVDPYVDGDAPDGDIFYVTTGATFPAIDFLANAFAYFGLVGGIAGIVYPTLLAFTAWFTAAAATLVSLIFTIMTAITFIVGFVIDWFTRMVNFFISLFTIIGSIFDGTYTGGLSNLWVVFNVSAWIDFVPVLAFMLWFGNLSKRVRNSGRSSIEIIIGDIQIVMYIVGEVWSWSYTVFSFVLSTIGQLASRF